MLRDGTRYRIDTGQVTWIRDRNGNQLTSPRLRISWTKRYTITDSLNRQGDYHLADYGYGL